MANNGKGYVLIVTSDGKGVKIYVLHKDDKQIQEFWDLHKKQKGEKSVSYGAADQVSG